MNKRRTKVILVLLPLLLFVALPRSASAQQVQQVVRQIAAAWAKGDVQTIASYASRSGISLDLKQGELGPLAPRQASAILRRVFDLLETVSIQEGMTQVVGGTPARAFGELSWTSRVKGTTIAERATVYFEFVVEGDRWHITQIRLLR
jgi:hypothetical protein